MDCNTFFLKQIPKDVTVENIRKNYNRLLILAKQGGIKPRGDGCCNGILTAKAKKIRGYDESYIGYGAEDSDFALRALLFGANKKWIHKKTNMIHLPHLKVGKYYKYIHDGETILLEAISINTSPDTSWTVRYRSTQKSCACSSRGGRGVCKGVSSEYQTCWIYNIEGHFKEISQAKGILILGTLDEKA